MIGVKSTQLQTPKTELLSRQEEYDLILRAKAGDERALKRLIHKNLGLIKKEANREKHHVDWNVLVAAGEMGVSKAVEGFNLSTGNRFSTYAVPAIHSEIRDCVCRETGVSRTTMENLAKISKASTDLTLELSRDPTLAEIIERSELSEQQIFTAWKKKAFSQPASLNRSLVEGGHEFLDLLEDKTIDIWVDAQDGEILGTLDQLENDGHLEERQIQILIAKHQGYTNKEVGRELGVSGERVRQLFKGAREALSAFAEGTLKPIRTKVSPIRRNIEPIGEGDQLSLDLPVPEQAAEPVVKRVDALRLGGRIGRAIKKFFTKTKEDFDVEKFRFESNRAGESGKSGHQVSQAYGYDLYLDDHLLMGKTRFHSSGRKGCSENLSQRSISQTGKTRRFINVEAEIQGSPGNRDVYSTFSVIKSVCSTPECRQDPPAFSRSTSGREIGGLIHAAKHLLVFRRGSDHRLADQPGYQSTPTDQRRHRLGQARTAWRRCLEVGQVISKSVMQPFASVYQSIRGFGSNLSRWRTNIQLSTANVFKNFGIAQEHDRARPPTENHELGTRKVNSFIFGGTKMDLAHKKATTFGFALVIFASILSWGLVNDNWSQAPETLRPFSTYDWAAVFKDSGEYDSFPEDRLQFLVSTLVSQSKFLELSLVAGYIAWLSRFLTLSGLNVVYPSKEDA